MHTLSSLLMWRSMAMTSICLGMALSTKALSRPDSSSSCSRVCTALARGPNAVSSNSGTRYLFTRRRSSAFH